MIEGLDWNEDAVGTDMVTSRWITRVLKKMPDQFRIEFFPAHEATDFETIREFPCKTHFSEGSEKGNNVVTL